jgi:tetratricopeptide (TPR) repeat protein
MRIYRHNEALPYLEQVAHENPTNYMTLRNLARCYKIVLSNFQAVATFQQTIGLCATNWEDHALLGLCLCNLGNLKTSEDEYREAIKWMPTNSVWREETTLDMLGVVIKQRERSAEAIAEIMKFQDANPTNQRSCSLLAECHRLAGDIRSAQKVLRRGLEVLPEATDLWAQLANVEIEIDPPDAMKCAQHALALCPSNFLAHCTLAYLNKTFQHDMAASKTNYEAAIRDNPERKEPYNALGEMFGKAGDVDTAERYFLKSLEIDTTDSTALTSEGYARYLKHDYVGAIDYHARAIAADPKCGLAHYNMALACLETGEYERGIEHWHKAKEVGCKVNERLLQKLEQGRKAIESQPTRL